MAPFRLKLSLSFIFFTILLASTGANPAASQAQSSSQSASRPFPSFFTATHVRKQLSSQSSDEEELVRTKKIRTDSSMDFCEKELLQRALENNYKACWITKKLSPRQEQITEIICTATGLPQELATIAALYCYEFQGICSQTLTEHTHKIFTLVVLPNGDLASGSRDNTIKVWSLLTGPNRRSSWTCIQTLTEHTGFVLTLAILPNGSLASGASDSTIKIWSLKNGSNEKACWENIQTLTEHTNNITTLAALPNGGFASGSLDKTIKIWAPKTNHNSHASWTCTQTIREPFRVSNSIALLRDGQITALAALPNGQLVSGSENAVSENNVIKIWTLITSSNGKASWTLSKAFVGHTSDITALTALPNGGFASGFADKTINIWSPASTDPNGEISWTCTQTLIGNTGGISSLAILPNKDLASGSYDGTIKIWVQEANANGKITWRYSRTITGHVDGVKTLTVLPNGNIASGSFDNAIKIWE